MKGSNAPGEQIALKRGLVYSKSSFFFTSNKYYLGDFFIRVCVCVCVCVCDSVRADEIYIPDLYLDLLWAGVY